MSARSRRRGTESDTLPSRRPAVPVAPSPAWWKSPKTLALGIGGAVIVVGLLLGGVALQSGGASKTPSDATAAAALASDAEANAGGPVRVLRGTHHTVYHSDQALPTPAAPRSDGKYTVVWFSGTWCEYCEQMEPFTHHSAPKFRDRMVFIEKSVDDDRGAAQHLGVRGTPTFVVLDARGQAVGRFGFQPTAAAFESLLVQVTKPRA